jgi:acyl-coenzyme A thioesterase PaaI-like protein
MLSIYPPYLGAGVRVRLLGHAPLAYEASMKLHWWNRNYVGTHFGGSLFSMTDPFFMLILIDALGSGYTVWSKRSTIRFLRPARGRVRARFEIPREAIERLRGEVDAAGRATPGYVARIHDESAETVAEVEQWLSVKLRAPAPAP